MSRRKFSSKFKTQVAIDALKEQMTIQQLASKHNVHPSQITSWKKEFLENATAAFENQSKQKLDSSKEDELYAKIGRLQTEVEFLKKVLGK
ncbi:MAG: transposase [Crocinitomicaceae bacterium]